MLLAPLPQNLKQTSNPGTIHVCIFHPSIYRSIHPWNPPTRLVDILEQTQHFKGDHLLILYIGMELHLAVLSLLYETTVHLHVIKHHLDCAGVCEQQNIAEPRA